MSEIKDGGPAFPVSTARAEDGSFGHQDGHYTWQFGGLTMRDWFASQAMPEIYGRVESGGFERVATLAYEMADAMLRARGQS